MYIYCAFITFSSITIGLYSMSHFFDNFMHESDYILSMLGMLRNILHYNLNMSNLGHHEVL